MLASFPSAPSGNLHCRRTRPDPQCSGGVPHRDLSHLCTASARIHSRYCRILADLPWAPVPVHLHLHVRRFFCDTSFCGRRTFTERVPTVARPYAHTTTRVRQAQCDTGLALGGAAGVRQLARHGLPGSRQTVLRQVRGCQPTQGPAPRVIGIDDWAYRKC